MKSHPLFNTARIFHSGCPIWLAILICFLCSACFKSQRDYSQWSDPKQSDEQYAILPVLPELIRITLEEDLHELSFGESNIENKEETARVINEVLDTIAAGESNPLVGPKKIDSVLKLQPDWKYLEVYLQDPAPLNEPWKREGLSAISLALGGRLALRVSPTLYFKPYILPDIHKFQPTYRCWRGRIIIEIEMLDLANALVITRSTGEADFYGALGIAVISGSPMGQVPFTAIPLAFGKDFDGAVDQAAREALTKLFEIPQEGEAVQ